MVGQGVQAEEERIVITEKETGITRESQSNQEITSLDKEKK
tara:strand:- start:126 stop:248 length:123 start_codon:yes stop_codon:yes gene_type:complete